MNNIAIYEKIDNPNTMNSLREMGTEYAKSGFFGITNASQGLVMAITCVAEGITPIEFNRIYHVIENKLSMKADAMQAKFQESGGRIVWKQTTADICEAAFSHKDYCPDGVIVRVTLAELKESGVAIGKGGGLKDIYRKYPRQMLRARAISEGVRMVNPSIIAGYYTPEEVSDFDDKPRRTQSDLLPPKAKRTEPEPKEAEVMVVDEEPTDAFLLANEDAVNAYLTHLKWIPENLTWRDLGAHHRATIDGKLSSFLKKAKAYAEQQMETANA